MDKEKAEFTERFLEFVNTDSLKAHKKWIKVIQCLEITAERLIIPPKPYGGGFLLQMNALDGDTLKSLQREMKVFLWQIGKHIQYDFEALQLNYSLGFTPKIRLLMQVEKNGDVHSWLLRLGFAWAIDGLTSGCVGECACGRFFVQHTARKRVFCSKECLVKAYDAKRKDTLRRTQQLQVNQIHAYKRKLAKIKGKQPDDIKWKQLPGRKHKTWIA